MQLVTTRETLVSACSMKRVQNTPNRVKTIHVRRLVYKTPLHVLTQILPDLLVDEL